MIPFADLVNHQSYVESFYGINEGVDGEDSPFKCWATECYSPGQEIFQSYGSHKSVCVTVSADFSIFFARSNHDGGVAHVPEGMHLRRTFRVATRSNRLLTFPFTILILIPHNAGHPFLPLLRVHPARLRC
jgi:hypothetical protein